MTCHLFVMSNGTASDLGLMNLAAVDVLTNPTDVVLVLFATCSVVDAMEFLIVTIMLMSYNALKSSVAITTEHFFVIMDSASLSIWSAMGTTTVKTTLMN